MLTELIIKDFAIIKSLSLRFNKGLNILSGETGAGKSIIVGAVTLLLGGRTSADMIRSEKNDAVVEAVFEFDHDSRVKTLLSEWGITTEENQLVVRRLISRNGKNRIYLGGQSANIQMLNQLGSALIDISGQYSQQLLLQTDHHIHIIDIYGGHNNSIDNFKALFNGYITELDKLYKLVKKMRELENQRELYSFQYDELKNASLSPGEEEALVQERNILANAKSLHDITYRTYLKLYEDDNALISAIKMSLKDIAEAAVIDSSLDSPHKNLESVTIELEDIAQALRAYSDTITTDPERLELIESRIDALYRLKKKYSKDINELIEYQNFLEQSLGTMETSNEEIDQLTQTLCRQAGQLWDCAEQLTEMRRKTAAKLKKAVEKELISIGMEKTEFYARIQSSARPEPTDPSADIAGLTPSGRDTVEFFISPNKGEQIKPLSKIASGGELSRIVLAIKKIMAEKYLTPTLLFDEVDTGIGGAVAEAVGQKLHEISKSHQVLCITHLPQIACFGSTHYNVAKESSNNRTVTRVDLLDHQSRIIEISRMLGGKNITAKTQAHAVEMLKNAQNP